MAPTKAGSAHDGKIPVTTLSELVGHMHELGRELSLPETEDTWAKLERALLRLQAITKGGGAKYADFVSLVMHKSIAAPINSALLSERTRLSGTAGDLLNSIAPRLADRFEPLVPVFVPTLLLICARTNKVATKRAEKTLYMIARHCRLPSLLPFLRDAARDKSQGLRATATGVMLAVLESTEKERLNRRVADFEASIKATATDSNPEVRQISKKLFELYIFVWPERVQS